MLSQKKPKPYRIRWVEAERELASRGVILRTIPSPKRYTEPRIPHVCDPSKAKPSKS